MNIYVGNLPYSIAEEELGNIFAQYGQVDSVNIIKDQFSGRSKGFGFVEMPTDNEADAAIMDLDGREINGRNIKVNKAKPRNNGPRFQRRY